MPRSMFSIAIVVLALLFASNSLFVIKELERGVKLQFGRIVEDNLKPGLGFKIPFVQEIRRFDGRVLVLDLDVQDYLTIEKKRLAVDSFVMWRITDVGKFYTSTGGVISQAQLLLSPRINEGLRNKFGELTFDEVISGKRDELMDNLTKEVDLLTRDAFGLSVLDIRVKKIELPPSVSDAVYNRMRAERDREAREYRSKGKEQYLKITSEADRNVRIVEARAFESAEKIRGDGDQEAARIYAEAYSSNREFYDFYRSMSAYKNSFSTKSDILLLEPKGEFFEYLNVGKAN